MSISSNLGDKIAETRDFVVNSASLKEVRSFSREVFERIEINQDLKDELVLAIAEAAQNIVKHAYKGIENTEDKMEIKISLSKITSLKLVSSTKGNLLMTRK